ncbi:hypothetical protein [Mesobacillus zeae]|uniref:Uncharacterized protein n=1 Tax=Mesobacillus zeae TaxID=1917180 RepID=A0A398BN92_9BACI|nr:hypothetical protein [Mesobacillus zeae]RID88826.1 hypothetical protein D1970_00845 [Mesobacillus zeae]
MRIPQMTKTDGFQSAYSRFKAASLSHKRFFQHAVFQEAFNAAQEPGGIEKIYQQARNFDSDGVFNDRVWNNPASLNPSLVRAALSKGGMTAGGEIMSLLRILSIARGKGTNPIMTAQACNEFLSKALLLNMDLLILRETEENRIYLLHEEKLARKVVSFVGDNCFSPVVFQSIQKEIENLASQRPIVVKKIIQMITKTKRLTGMMAEAGSGWAVLDRSLHAPSSLSASFGSGYKEALGNCSDLLLVKEAFQLRTTMENTGIVSVYHAVFLMYINKEKPYLIQSFLCIDEQSKTNLRNNLPLIRKLVDSAVNYQTRQCIYGLMRLLQRDILTPDLKSLLDELNNWACKKNTQASGAEWDHSPHSSAVVAAAISILGQPLGVGQGFNPACEPAAVMSYWSQKEPTLLIKLLLELLSTERISLEFEGKSILSSRLPLVELEDHENIDVVSLLMFPPLLAIRDEMVRRSGETERYPQKAVHPGFYVTGIWKGFIRADEEDEFEKKFYQHYHPSSQVRAVTGLPQPAVILIYNREGIEIGKLTVLIQRVTSDGKGKTRVYFYSPNNDSLQEWSKGIKTSISGNGEKEGESSLLFKDFLECLHSFHFDDKQTGDHDI